MKPKTKETLETLKLNWLVDHWDEELERITKRKLGTEEALEHLLQQEALQKQDKLVERRIREAKFPVQKALGNFDWTWPKTIDKSLIEYQFNLKFLKNATNLIMIGSVGVGKTHLASALGRTACEAGKRVRFITAVELVNELIKANQRGNLAYGLRKYSNIELLVLDELGYLPIQQEGAELLFQVLSRRYERCSTVITTNKAYKDWAQTFNGDAGITSAVLDRLLHRSETIVIKGKSYRMRDIKD